MDGAGVGTCIVIDRLVTGAAYRFGGGKDGRNAASTYVGEDRAPDALARMPMTAAITATITTEGMMTMTAT